MFKVPFIIRTSSFTLPFVTEFLTCISFLQYYNKDAVIILISQMRTEPCKDSMACPRSYF